VDLGDRTKLTQTMRFATTEERDTMMHHTGATAAAVTGRPTPRLAKPVDAAAAGSSASARKRLSRGLCRRGVCDHSRTFRYSFAAVSVSPAAARMRPSATASATRAARL
jgi:hypothetical protein